MPISELASVLANDFGCAVSATAINDDVFQVRVMLTQYRVNCVSNQSLAVVRGCDDTNFWKMLRFCDHGIWSSGALGLSAIGINGIEYSLLSENLATKLSMLIQVFFAKTLIIHGIKSFLFSGKPRR